MTADRCMTLIDLGARSYEIHVGPALLDEAAALIAPLLPVAKTVVVTDENVMAAQGARLRASLSGSIETEFVVLPPGEATKSFAQLEALTEKLLEARVERSDAIVAFGGGVIGDLTGFAASILRRGVRFIQIPTTLLAQVDSSVGGKTGVNTRHGKNLVGAFHQPSLVICDLDVLDTLPIRHMRAGYAEILKYGALGDEAFFSWLEVNGARILGGDREAQRRAVATSCKSKAAIVARDEREAGERALLNLGHTFAHALETAYGYSDRLLHGEAVAAGMGLAFDFSVAEGLCPSADASRLKTALRNAGLPAGLEDLDNAGAFSAEFLIGRMMQDKKNAGGQLTLILAEALGRAKVVRNAPTDAVRAFLEMRLAALN